MPDCAQLGHDLIEVLMEVDQPTSRYDRFNKTLFFAVKLRRAVLGIKNVVEYAERGLGESGLEQPVDCQVDEPRNFVRCPYPNDRFNRLFRDR
ncbi:hypothetical protein D3C84_1170330 [compost metagenome]